MWFQWLKKYMPRSLYGRALLILVLPVVSLQLVVSVVFINRHFDAVTWQLSNRAAAELSIVLDQITRAPTQTDALTKSAESAKQLDVSVSFVTAAEVPAADQWRWYDLTAPGAIDEIKTNMPEIAIVTLQNIGKAQIFIPTRHGMVRFTVDRWRLSATNTHQLFVNMVFFGFLMTLISYLYLRNQLRPIKRLADAAEAFGRGRSVRYIPSGATEVRAAGAAFLDMRGRIERQIDQRTMMLSGISHDLRTPLTRLKLGLSMIDHEDRDDLDRDVAEMQGLLDEFLNFARNDAEGEFEKTNITNIIEASVEAFLRSGAMIKLSIEGEPQMLNLRPSAMRRAVDNLISNAVRYGSRVEVTLTMTKKFIRIRVEDNGPGIPEHQRDEAVKPFSRLDPSRNRNHGGGVGLGLAIASDIARAHGGTLRLGQSETLGGLQADIVIAP